MTLVVARQAPDGIYIVSDTKLSFEQTKEKLPVIQGVLKSKIIAPSLAVAFAGNEYRAEIAIGGIDAEKRDEIVPALLAAHRDSVADFKTHGDQNAIVDFLIASLDEPPALIEVKDEHARPTRAAWIGSSAAFYQFRKYEHEGENAANPAPQTFEMSIIQTPDGASAASSVMYSRMVHSLRSTISDPTVPEVGGFVCPIATHDGAFSYLGYLGVSSAPFEIEQKKEWQTLPFGTAEGGGYAFDFWPVDGNRGASSYFRQGRFGLVYLPSNGALLRPIYFRDLSPLEFEETATAAVGSRVRTCYYGHGELIQRAQHHLYHGDIAQALSYANRAVEVGPKDALTWKCRGDVYARQGRFELAQTDYARAVVLRMNPK